MLSAASGSTGSEPEQPKQDRSPVRPDWKLEYLILNQDRTSRPRFSDDEWCKSFEYRPSTRERDFMASQLNLKSNIQAELSRCWQMSSDS